MPYSSHRAIGPIVVAFAITLVSAVAYAPGSAVAYAPQRRGGWSTGPALSRGQRAAIYRSMREEPTGLSREHKKLVAPDPADVAAYEPLESRGVRLVRLFPYVEDKNDRYTVSADAPPTNVVWGKGGFYSFARKTHASRQWTEVVFADGRFVGDVSRDALGLLTNLGDVAIDSVTPSTPGVAELAGLLPPDDRPTAVALAKRLRAGTRFGRHEASASIEATPNATYALRSILYDRNDALYVFRVVRRAQDGSVTILWRELKEYDKPRLNK